MGLAAGQLAVRLINHLVRPEEGFDFPEQLHVFLRRAERMAFGPSTSAIIEEAVSRDIPWIRLNEHSLVQLGQGVHAQRIRATMTSRTGALAVDIAGDKDLTTKLLASAGLPVPRSESVRTVEAAVAAADRIGYPVVVKPLDGNHGRGVCLDLGDADAVRAAFDVAEGESRRGSVMVESFVTGRDYRCLIVGGRMQAIAERVPAHVVGDGEHTVAELVDITNADPRRGVGHEKVLTRITVDAAATDLVRSQGYSLDDVPPAGEMVKLALTGNMSTGGISVDRTFDAHPDNVEIAEEAARMIGLDVAGIDFICPDIASPVRETGGAICEVNAAPGFRMHTHPTVGEPQFIAKPVVDLLFPPGAPSRVPIVAVTGTNGKTTTARMIAHIFKGLGRKVGMTSTDGVVIDERLVIKADASGPKSARMVLQNPRVDFAVMEVARGGILREGLGYDRNDVAVVTNVAPDHLGMRGINTLEQLAAVKAVVVEAVPRDGFAVLNADDELVRAMRRRCSGGVVWFSLQPPGSEEREFIDEQCRRGGRAVVLEPTDKGDMITIRHGRRSMQLAWTHLLPSTFGGAAKMNVANALAAAGAAFAAGAPLHDIRQGLRTFTTSYYLSPGRMNLLDVHHVDVVVDYCHNAPGMRMLGDFVESLLRPEGRAGRPGQGLADRHDRRGRRPAGRRHPRAGHGGRRPLRRHRRPRGPPAARPRAGRRRRAGRRGHPGPDGGGQHPLPPDRGRPGRAGRRPALHGAGQPRRPRRALRRPARDGAARARAADLQRPGRRPRGHASRRPRPEPPGPAGRRRGLRGGGGRRRALSGASALRRPPEAHVGLALVVALAGGALHLHAAVARVERQGGGVALEHPEPEAAGLPGLRVREQRRPDAAALRGGVDVQVVQPAVRHRCVAGHPAPPLGDRDRSGGDEHAADPGARLLVRVRPGQPRHRRTPRRQVDLGDPVRVGGPRRTQGRRRGRSRRRPAAHRSSRAKRCSTSR